MSDPRIRLLASLMPHRDLSAAVDLKSWSKWMNQDRLFLFVCENFARHLKVRLVNTIEPNWGRRLSIRISNNIHWDIVCLWFDDLKPAFDLICFHPSQSESDGRNNRRRQRDSRAWGSIWDDSMLVSCDPLMDLFEGKMFSAHSDEPSHVNASIWDRMAEDKNLSSANLNLFRRRPDE